jgi:hypothetical protein
VLTLSWPSGSTTTTRTFRGSFTPAAGDTWSSVLSGAYDDVVKNHLPRKLPGPAAVVFWALEPEEL